MDRRTAVLDLVELRRPVADAVNAVRTFPWDAEEELATLGPGQLGHVLDLFLAGNLSAQELEDWANAVEGRDDIAFEPREVVDFLSELANPLLHKALTVESVRDLRGRIIATG